MDQTQNPSSSKADRKTVERNRRNQMKALYSKLNSLVMQPQQSNSTEAGVSLMDQLDGATNYIKRLQSKLEKLKQKKSCLINTANSSTARAISSSSTNGGVQIPNLDIRITGSAMEVVLITGQNCQFLFSETIRLLHEEGADVVTASFSVVDGTIFHTIHSKIGECAQDCYGAPRICERLRKFVSSNAT